MNLTNKVLFLLRIQNVSEMSISHFQNKMLKLLFTHITNISLMSPVITPPCEIPAEPAYGAAHVTPSSFTHYVP